MVKWWSDQKKIGTVIKKLNYFSRLVKNMSTPHTYVPTPQVALSPIKKHEPTETSFRLKPDLTVVERKFRPLNIFLFSLTLVISE